MLRSLFLQDPTPNRVISLIDSCLETLWGGWQETNTVHKNGCAVLSVTRRKTFIFIDLHKTIDWGLIRQHMAHCVALIVRAFIMKCKWRYDLNSKQRSVMSSHTLLVKWLQWPDASRCYRRIVLVIVIKAIDPRLMLSHGHYYGLSVSDQYL